ncbi:hypothetical protein [uncultured Lacinutrix sp.]|uniref:hypothetical protein n=1 Tax=uncultured Lacinutrix sp. TaxID=574032 RepID=UPI00260F441D|nr:hypothetical protein [uncultured Lacinutrix sp.]
MLRKKKDLMIFNFLDLNKESQRVRIPITEKRFKKISKKNKGRDFDNMNYYLEFMLIRDYLFLVFILNPYMETVKIFFRKIQLSQLDFEDTHKNDIIKAADVYYHVYYWNSIFIASEPSTTFYSNGIIKDRLELHLEFDTELLESVLEQLLEALGIDYEAFQEEEDLSTFEIEADSLVTSFLLECWQDVKQETQSKVFGMLFEGTGIGGMYDLDNAKDIEATDSSIEAYVKSKGIIV